jgi:hypothetical protein
MWTKFLKSLSTLANQSQFICIYGCGYSGTYNDVQAHQSAAHGYGK